MGETLLKQRRAQYCQALEDALGGILDRLTKMPEVEKVILFGSYAAGRRDLFTDLDILVVMDTQENFADRTARLYRQLSTDVDMDLLVYTPQEFERKRRSGFVKQALATGQVMHEKQRP
jgi:predicted nucleotidyltransferase